MATKKTKDLTLTDRLSRLTYANACKLLGARGAALIRAGGAHEIDLDDDVTLTPTLLRVQLPAHSAEVTMCLADGRQRRLCWHCSRCEVACEHVGAAMSLVLEEKMALGLAAPPLERVPVESLDDDELVRRALADRAERARAGKMILRALDPGRPWSDYTITNAASGKTYRVALRGEDRGASYCSCPDFRKNTLGTCKHVLYALARIRRRFPAAARARRYRRRGVSVHLDYTGDLTLRLRLPDRPRDDVKKIVGRLADRPVTDIPGLVRRLRKLERAGHRVTVYPDAEEYIQRRLIAARTAERMAAIRRDPAGHPLRTGLLATELLPYQLDGIAFAVAAGRAILADDMGLGKTIQGIGVAELLAREADISRVLVICPASLKSQWRAEIERFSDRDCQLVLGTAEARAAQYATRRFFTVCNYEQVLRDILAIEQIPWDLIVLDEGQRIKNWEAKTSGVVKSLRSRFALVLTGTPIENRLDDLYSLVEFVDDRRLGPAFRFLNRHRVTDDRGKVLGYKNLAELREDLAPILLRRTRASVLDELPPRTNEIVRIPPTDEQLALHNSHKRIVASIINKHYLTEMDLLRLQKALLMCRLAADGTFLVDKQQPGYSSKLQVLDDLLARLFCEDGRKIVLFSEWTRMLDRIGELLDRRGLAHVRLDGSVPQKQRQALVHRFNRDPDCKLFITTNAGSTGLNLQAANTVINVDLPWNPAVLEQRIARAHRMGQKRPVHVFVLVTEDTLEESLLATLSAKHELALAALDPDSDVDEVGLSTGIEDLKRRLEVLLGAKPEAPVDESGKRDTEREARLASAGGQLFSAAFAFLGELLPEPDNAPATVQLAAELRAQLAASAERDPATGRPTLSFTLPDAAALDTLADSLARILATSPGAAKRIAPAV